MWLLISPLCTLRKDLILSTGCSLLLFIPPQPQTLAQLQPCPQWQLQPCPQQPPYTHQVYVSFVRVTLCGFSCLMSTLYHSHDPRFSAEIPLLHAIYKFSNFFFLNIQLMILAWPQLCPHRQAQHPLCQQVCALCSCPYLHHVNALLFRLPFCPLHTYLWTYKQKVKTNKQTNKQTNRKHNHSRLTIVD